ncbi:hypothetical protein KP79_PYT01282 [Mizuhopecten yessoensis]|uniref:DUF6589 domain-containing protein n=1 Tax=Mizuhopecten yessoensis TaxID=6573 RepID=A0A210QG16_MIZYE|nr:hypothetical protein KP79_PYT01282 [Mizuhopecten yessoensis]
MMEFTWDKFYEELQIRAPNILKVVSAIESDIPMQVSGKKFLHILHTVASGLHGRSQEMSALHYQVGFILVHGGCTAHDITRLAKLGISMTPQSVHGLLAKWKENLDAEIIKLKEDWEIGENVKYQLVGDNWDKNILPSFRTSQQQTISLHLFNLIAVVDRVKVLPVPSNPLPFHDIKLDQFLPSPKEQELLKAELVFIVATSVIANIPQLTCLLQNIYPKHLNHKYSTQAGLKTTQYPFGLFDCNETKTTDVIQLLKDLQKKYVPYINNEIKEPLLFGGDRLTDERFQGAQQALSNGETASDRLEGFISKIEDFHRLMNFLEVIMIIIHYL